MTYANCGTIAVIASMTYMTIVELFDEYPTPFSPEMTMIVISVERNRSCFRSIITTILLPFLTW